MKVLGNILLACVVLAALQAALTVALAVVGILLLIGLLTCPAETFGFMIIGLLYWVLQNYPAAGVCLAALFILMAVLLPKGDSGAPSKPTAALPSPADLSRPEG